MIANVRRGSKLWLEHLSEETSAYLLSLVLLTLVVVYNGIFEDNGTFFSHEKDTIIYHESDHSNYIYLINKGSVKCHQIDKQGKELVTALFKEPIANWVSRSPTEIRPSRTAC